MVVKKIKQGFKRFFAGSKAELAQIKRASQAGGRPTKTLRTSKRTRALLKSTEPRSETIQGATLTRLKKFKGSKFFDV